MSPEVLPARSPRARRAGDVARHADQVVRRLHAMGIDPGPAGLGPSELERATLTLDRGTELVTGLLADAGTRRRAELAAVLVELHDARRSVRALRMAGRARPAEALEQSVTRLRNVSSTTGLLDRVCAEAAQCTGLTRVALSTVAESDWSVCRLHVDGEPDAEVPSALFAMSQDDAAAERQVLRDGRGTVVPPHAATPMRAAFSASHVVVPVPITTGTVGLLHGDHHPTDRPTDEIDRDLLAAFGRAFGQIYERTALQERLDGQRRALLAALEAESAAADGLGAADFGLPIPGHEQPAAAVTGPAGTNAAVDALMTPREREVLALILAGASNGVIAERLVITTGTVKSHVKRVLRKLGAANRSEAISRYFELGGDGA